MTTVKEAGLATIDMKLEVIVIPVSDAERAEQFYRKLGWTVMKYEKEIVISGEPTTSSRIAPCEEFVGFSSIIKSDDHRALGSDYR